MSRLILPKTLNGNTDNKGVKCNTTQVESQLKEDCCSPADDQQAILTNEHKIVDKQKRTNNKFTSQQKHRFGIFNNKWLLKGGGLRALNHRFLGSAVLYSIRVEDL